jgi:predicted Zn-dependent protease
VVDDPAVNAFAVPGGFVYVTRGIAAMNSAGSWPRDTDRHVTARHSVSQMSKQLPGSGAAGMILSPEVAQFGNLAAAGLGVLFMKFSRSDESQSDQLGLKYMMNGGYDPREIVDVFTTLERVSQQAGAGRLPQWMSTHPDPENARPGPRARCWLNKTSGNDRQPAGFCAAGRHRVRREPAEGFFQGTCSATGPGIPD